jgi:HK97 family phage portal protein
MGVVSLPSWVEQLKAGDKLTGTIDAYSRFPPLYRAVNIRADTLSSMPFKVERDGELSDWYFRTSLQSLLRDTERSLLLTGAAFWLKLMNGRVLVGFQVLNPLTITVDMDMSKFNGLDPKSAYTFTQNVNNKTWKFDTNQIIYFREPSFVDEVRHGLAPAEVAMQASQLGYYLDRFTAAFFEHGAQPVTIMSMPIDVSKDELSRFSSDWLARFNGVINGFRTAFIRGGDIKTTVITPPIKDLTLTELYDRAVAQTAMALGVPLTMLESKAANYATADSDRMSFYSETIIPRLALYEQVINQQLLEPVGYKLTFQPEALTLFQVDEAQRAQSLLLLTQAGIPVRDGMVMLGMDYVLTPSQDLPPSIDPSPATPAPEVPIIEDNQPQNVRAYTLWRRKAEKRFTAGKSLNFPFTSPDIDGEDAAWIAYHLPECTSMHDIKHLFDDLKAVGVNDDERALYNAIYAILRKKGGELALILSNNLGYEIQDDFFDDLAMEITPIISDKMQGDLIALQERYTIDIDDALEQTLITKQIDAYMPKLIKGLTDTTRNLVKQVVDNARANGGITNEELIRQLTPAFGRRRAEMIAVTEYTRSASNATTVYRDYLQDFGIDTQRVWNTENDEIVRKCPICYPLNGKSEEVWGERFPDGAPAHPRCRCDISIRIVK